MNKDEKNAVDGLRKILFLTMQANECELSNNDFKYEIEIYNKILKLIEKQQRKINDAIDYLAIDDEIMECCDMFDVNGIELLKILRD